MFKYSPDLTNTQKVILIADREEIIICCFSFLLWAALIVKTYRGSKLRFAYVIAGLNLAQNAASIVECVICNWAYLGEDQKGITPEEQTNFKYVDAIFKNLADMFFQEAHWIFCWRYWKVAELLG